jgi:pyruvate,water dikinase
MSMAEAQYWYGDGVWHAFALTRGTEYQLHNFLEEHASGQFSSGQFLSGLPSRGYQAQVQLWRIAQMIRAEPGLLGDVIATPPRQLLAMLRGHGDAAAVCPAIDEYFQRYGHQIFTLDFVEPSEAENPTNLMQSLLSLVLQADYDPVARQRELAERRVAAMRSARKKFKGQLQRRFLWRLWLARRFYPNREEAMFHMGRAWTVLRPLAREIGRRLVDVGTLTNPDDVFFLRTEELGRAVRAIVIWPAVVARGREQDFPGGAGIPAYAHLAIERRALREARRNLTPPTHIPGPPLWASAEEPSEHTDTNILKGSAVSPGRVTGEVSRILSPADFANMKPGTILVCPTTTPAWTQLFPQATGLVTDIGGILAHGSIVAREYGIPAVLGIADATQRIGDGDVITVDGDRGIVTLESDSSDS